MTDHSIARPGRGRRPKDEVRGAVIEAAAALLFETGLSGFTIEKVAERAAVSRVTIHRWWPSKGALAFDVYRESIEQQLNIADSGDVWSDLRAALRSFVQVMTTTPAGRLLREFVGLAQLDADLRGSFVEHYARRRREHATTRIVEAQRVGQIRRDVDPNSIVDQLWGACYHRLLTSDVPVTTEFSDQLVDDVMRGVRVDNREERAATHA